MSEELEARAKHLEFILGVTDRQARNSFVLKGWSVTLVAAFFLLTTRGVNPQLAMIAAFLPSLTFWGLDAYYLRKERLFRRLYDEVRLGKTDENLNPFTLNTNPYRRRVSSWQRTVISPSVIYFHGIVIMTVILALVFFSWDMKQKNPQDAKPDIPTVKSSSTTQ